MKKAKEIKEDKAKLEDKVFNIGKNWKHRVTEPIEPHLSSKYTSSFNDTTDRRRSTSRLTGQFRIGSPDVNDIFNGAYAVTTHNDE